MTTEPKRVKKNTKDVVKPSEEVSLVPKRKKPVIKESVIQKEEQKVDLVTIQDKVKKRQLLPRLRVMRAEPFPIMSDEDSRVFWKHIMNKCNV